MQYIILFIFIVGVTHTLKWLFRIIYYAALYIKELLVDNKHIRNLRTAYKWSRMPIEELNAMWEKNSRKGYVYIRANRKCMWLCRYILTTRVRKYRASLPSHLPKSTKGYL